VSDLAVTEAAFDLRDPLDAFEPADV
jgi:hypothetical protein